MQNAIDEMNRFLTETVTAAEMTADDDGLPFETIDAFSTDPIGFGELSERMLSRVEMIFDQTVLYNRHSAKYLKACAMLERGIKYLGSACLTKIALEKKNRSFPELRQLSTDKLYRMASFNYRKLDTALTENVEKKHELSGDLLDMEFRYYNLLQRLRSTEVKIYDYHFKLYYEKEDFTPVIHGNAFSEKSGVKQYTKEHMDPPAFRNAPAFPLLSEAVSGKDSGCRIQDSENRDQVSGVRDQESDQRSVTDGQDSGVRIQDSEISCQESGQQSALSGQQDHVSDQRPVAGEQDSGIRNQDSGAGDRESDQRSVTGGQKIAGGDEEGVLPEAENKGSAAGSEADNSEVNGVRDSETAGEDHTGVTENRSADTGLNQAKKVPVDPAVLDQLTNQYTREEMVQMILDPGFVRRRPKLAGTLYYILYGDSQFLKPWITNSS